LKEESLNIERGIINFAPNLPGWRDVPLKKILEDEFNMKVVLENDANAAAWGERCFAGYIMVAIMVQQS